MRISALILLFFCLGIPHSANAAFLASSPVTIGIEATPEYPRAGESVLLNAVVGGAEKGDFTYTWFINGEELIAGVDLSSIRTPAPAEGVRVEVYVTVTDVGGNDRGGTGYVISPGSVDILWEGRTYTAPFYLGVPYATHVSRITLEAAPSLYVDGQKIPRGELVYTWEVGGKRLESDSGYGRYSAIIQPSRFKDATQVSVTVETRDKTHAAKSSVAIPILQPFPVVYEDKPLLGVQFNRALTGTRAFVGEEMRFRAFPFFVTNASATIYQWELNGRALPVQENDPSAVTFRRAGEGGGTFSVKLSVNPLSTFETAVRTFKLSL